MNTRISVLFEELRNTPFPELGKIVGDFPLYDALVAGTASSFLRGAKVDREAIPQPDPETNAMLTSLRKKHRLDAKEAAS